MVERLSNLALKDAATEGRTLTTFVFLKKKRQARLRPEAQCFFFFF